MKLKYVFSKTAKKQIFPVALQNYPKIRFKRLYKKFLFIFSRIFLQHFSNRLYSNVKIILVYFYIIKTI